MLSYWCVCRCNSCLFDGELAGRLHQQVLQSAIWRRSKQHVNYKKKHLFTYISHLVCFTPCRVWPWCTMISCFMKTCCRIFLQTYIAVLTVYRPKFHRFRCVIGSVWECQTGKCLYQYIVLKWIYPAEIMKLSLIRPSY